MATSKLVIAHRAILHSASGVGDQCQATLKVWKCPWYLSEVKLAWRNAKFRKMSSFLQPVTCLSTRYTVDAIPVAILKQYDINAPSWPPGSRWCSGPRSEPTNPGNHVCRSCLRARRSVQTGPRWNIWMAISGCKSSGSQNRDDFSIFNCHTSGSLSVWDRYIFSSDLIFSLFSSLLRLAQSESLQDVQV